MKKLKIMSVFGTRPEAIKMAPLIIELNKHNDSVEQIITVTAQHRQMLDQVLDAFSIKPHYDLNIMKESQTLTSITSNVLNHIKGVFEDAKPDICLVHGDTTTTFTTGLAAFYAGVKLGHVEAGLRTLDKLNPYPEEMNRRLTACLADYNFAPTFTSKANLLKENIPAERIFITGNTAIDTLSYTVKKRYTFTERALNNLDFSKRIIVMTSHRRESLGGGIASVCKAALRIVNDNSDVELVYAVHLNPAVRGTVFEILSGKPRVHLTDPLGITDMHNLISRAYMVMTDSGGLQEEAPFLGKPVLVLREVTERPEGLKAGGLMLAGVNEDAVYEKAALLLSDGELYERMSRAKNPFGDGQASKRIAGAILYSYGLTDEKPEDYLC